MRAATTSLRSVAGAVIAVFLFTVPAQAAIEPGDVIVADSNADGGAGALIRVDSGTGQQSVVSSNAISPQDLFVDPSAVALDSDGSLLVADREAFGGSGGVISVDPDSGRQTALSNHAISVLDLFADPSGIAVSATGAIYVADQNAYSGPGGVIGVNRETGGQFPVVSNANSDLDLFDDPYGIAIEAGGDLAVADLNGPPGADQTGAVVGVDLETSQEFLISSNALSGADLFEDPYGLAAEPNGNLLVANDSGTTDAKGVIRASRFSGQRAALSVDGYFSQPVGIDVAADGAAVVADPAAFSGGGGVIRVDRETGLQIALSNNFSSTPGLFVDPVGLLVVPPKCRGEYATMVGTDETDTIVGTAGRDVIVAQDGNDIVEGRDGADLICGGEGRNRLTGGDGNDTFSGGDAADVILGKAGADVASGGNGADKIDGGAGRDRLTAGKGNDNLVGGKAGDRLYGNPGRDKLFGDKGNDLLKGGNGPDQLTGGPGEDTLRGGPGRDRREQ
ncbi:MAG: hypothetical protein AABM29_04355 [Actinomycetota bacterium]